MFYIKLCLFLFLLCLRYICNTRLIECVPQNYRYATCLRLEIQIALWRPRKNNYFNGNVHGKKPVRLNWSRNRKVLLISTLSQIDRIANSKPQPISRIRRKHAKDCFRRHQDQLESHNYVLFFYFVFVVDIVALK